MKAAFAKMMEKNPTQSSHVAFRAGGNGVPILTRASGSSTSGFQTMGLPDGSRPMPGGGANKTSLGAYRMGDQDGNAGASAIYPNDIFGPYGQPDREYPERYFQNVGNNTFQPEYDDRATHALLKRLGDQKFKAESQAPFEDYRAQQRLARDLDEASRNASLSDLGTSREIIRNLAAERRQQSEDDYLRKMLDAGATPEAARKEIEDVRNANAIQEAKKVEDRSYQAKMLISRIAMSRGVTPMVKEPLNQSSSIDNPQRSQAMSQAMGMPGQGFGTSPLDANRQFMTPEFYKRYLRKSMASQETADEATAFSNMLTEGEIPPPPQGAFSMATMRGQERQQQVEMASEALASRLDTIRQRSVRVKLPLPKAVIAKEILEALYKSKAKTVGNRVIYSPETIQDMNPLQLLLAINWSVQHEANGYNNLKREVGKYSYGTEAEPSMSLVSDLKKIAYALNKNNYDIRIPFPSSSVPLSPARLVRLLTDIKTSSSPELRRDIESGRVDLLREINADDIPFTGETIELTGAAGGRSRRPSVAPAIIVSDMAQAPVPGAPGDNYDSLSNKELKALLKERGLNQGGNSNALKARLRAGTN